MTRDKHMLIDVSYVFPFCIVISHGTY